MRRRTVGLGCACESAPRSGMGGVFSKILDVAGATVGDPALGEQVAGLAVPGFAPITQTSGQIASTVLPAAQAALQDPGSVDMSRISTQAQQVAQASLPQTAVALAQAGYVFPAGSLGESLTRPTLLDAFGGRYRTWVMVGGLAALGLLALKEF